MSKSAPYAEVIGDPIEGSFLVLRTADGGHTWTPAPSVPPPREGEAAFAASGTCVVSSGADHAWIGTGGSASRVLRSTDGGRSWEAVPATVVSGQPTTGIYSVAFRDPFHGVVVGGDYTRPEETYRNAAFTRDGGVTWQSVPAGAAPRGQRSAVAWVPGLANTLVAAGRTGTDYSTDGGRTWRALGDEGFYALSFAPTGEGWAAGADGRVARLVLPMGEGAE